MKKRKIRRTVFEKLNTVFCALNWIRGLSVHEIIQWEKVKQKMAEREPLDEMYYIK